MMSQKRFSEEYLKQIDGKWSFIDETGDQHFGNKNGPFTSKDAAHSGMLEYVRCCLEGEENLVCEEFPYIRDVSNSYQMCDQIYNKYGTQAVCTCEEIRDRHGYLTKFVVYYYKSEVK